MKTETKKVPDDYFADGIFRVATKIVSKPEYWGGEMCIKTETSEPFPLDKKHRIHMVPVLEWEIWEDA